MTQIQVQGKIEFLRLLIQHSIFKAKITQAVVLAPQNFQVVVQSQRFQAANLEISVDFMLGVKIVLAIELLEICKIADVQIHQTVLAAVQRPEIEKLRNTGQIGNAEAMDVHLCDRRDLHIVEYQISVCITVFFHKRAECGIREIGCVYGEASGRVEALGFNQCDRFSVTGIRFG